MEEETTTTPDAPVAEATATPQVAQDDAQQTVDVDASVPTDTPVASEPMAEEPEDDYDYPQYRIPDMPQIDFSQMPADEDNNIDPNALAGAINAQIAAAEERATMRAQQSYQEQMAEQRAWEKAYEKHPELKTDKELRNLVHSARLGEVADLLSRNQDPRSVKLPTPGQVAERLFKHIGTAKQQGMKQATENTVIQASAHVETSGRVTNDSADARSKAFQNINNPNKDVAKQARADLLKSMLFGE